MRILTAVATVMIAGSAAAGPCETAERGTYLSNVCWLVEKFSEKGLPARIASADERTCTVRLSKRLGPYGDTIYFNRADPKDVKIEWTKYVTCWHMLGEGVNGEGNDKITLCGARVETKRVVRAFTNLYRRHCQGKKSEF